MSDFNEVVKRITIDRSFRADLLKDVQGTLNAHNYKVSGAELSELRSLDSSKLDQLDESILEQAVGGVSGVNIPRQFAMPSVMTSCPLMQGSLTTLTKMNVYAGLTRPGGKAGAAGTW